MKYTRSKDGVERLTIRTEFRLSKEDIDSLKPLAKFKGYSSVLKMFRTEAQIAMQNHVDCMWEDLEESDE